MPEIKKISFVIPAYNEEGNIEHLYSELSQVIGQLEYDYDIYL